MLSAPSVLILILVTVGPNAVVLSSRISVTTKTKSAVSSFELVTLDSTSNCMPGGQPAKDRAPLDRTECKYKAVNTKTGYFSGRNHKKLGKGHFAEALLVNPLKHGTSNAEVEKEYVWKRFLLDHPDAANAENIAKTALGKIKKLNCPHTLAPLDMNPEVVVQHKFSSATVKDNGFIFDKIDGDAEGWWGQTQEPGSNNARRAEKCAPLFLQEMLAALTCLRTANYVHTDVKLDNILYKESDGIRCPSWYLTDFDLLSTVNCLAPYATPPLNLLQTIHWDGSPVWPLHLVYGTCVSAIAHKRPLHLDPRFSMTVGGTEDFYSLVLAYAGVVDTKVSQADMCRFITYVHDNLFFKSVTDVFFPDRFPGLGLFAGDYNQCSTHFQNPVNIQKGLCHPRQKGQCQSKRFPQGGMNIISSQALPMGTVQVVHGRKFGATNQPLPMATVVHGHTMQNV